MGEQRSVLPAAQLSLQRKGPCLLEEPVAAPDKVLEVRVLAVKLVTNAHERAIRSTLMDRVRPQGTTTFAGAQLHYHFTSAHGTLGAIGSVAALYLHPRDAWITWSHLLRDKLLKMRSEPEPVPDSPPGAVEALGAPPLGMCLAVTAC